MGFPDFVFPSGMINVLKFERVVTNTFSYY